MTTTDTSYFDQFAAECDHLGVTAHPEGLVTRADVERMARTDILSRLTGCEYLTEDLSPLRQAGLDALIAAEVAEHAPHRHEARVEATVAKLRLAADAVRTTTAALGWEPHWTARPMGTEAHPITWPDEEIVARVIAHYRGGPWVSDVLSIVHVWCREQARIGDAVAMLLGLVALRGRGGPGDLGGPGGASALPILSWIRHQRSTGGAWVAALREAVWRLHQRISDRDTERFPSSGEISLRVDASGDLAIGDVYYDDGHRCVGYIELDRGILHPEVWRLLAEPAAVAVDYEAMPLTIHVPGHPGDTTIDASEAHPLDVAGAIALGRAGRISPSEMACPH